MNDIGQFGSHLFPPGVGNYNMNVRAYDPVHAVIEENIYDISFGHSRRLQEEQERHYDNEQERGYYEDGYYTHLDHDGHPHYTYSENDPNGDGNDYYYDEEAPEEEQSQTQE